MNAENSVTVRFSLYKYSNKDTDLPHPREIETPAGTIGRHWVSDTIMEAIWILYEFKSIEDKNFFVANPPEVFSAALIAERTQAYYDHWVSGIISNPNTWYLDSNKD